MDRIPKKTKTIIIMVAVLILAFQNCSNKGSIDLTSDMGPLVATVNAPFFIDPSTDDASALLGYGTVAQDSERGQVFQFTGNQELISNVRVKIDLTKIYRISGRFKSTGSTLSRLYFGVATYRANGEFIQSWESTRTGSVAIIDSVSGNIISVRTDLVGWPSGAVSSYAKAIGFYFNGDTNRLPDYVHTNWGDGSATPENGAYNTASGRTIQLNIPLPPSVLAQITSATRIFNHQAGGTYTYTAAAYNEVPATWQEFSGTISGFDMINSYNRFRAETDHIGFMLLNNYGQDSTATLLVDDLRFEVL